MHTSVWEVYVEVPRSFKSLIRDWESQCFSKNIGPVVKLSIDLENSGFQTLQEAQKVQIIFRSIIPEILGDLPQKK